MLISLHIKNVVLIKDLTLNFEDGFSVFTGETGAGKSILLDSLSLALGERANFSLIKKNEDYAEVIAVFVLKEEVIKNLLKENVIPLEDENLIIKRILHIDGKSKCFINDKPVSVTFLRQIGALLIDIHGQFDNQKLLNPSLHREILDSFLPNKDILVAVSQSFNKFKALQTEYLEKQAHINNITAEKEYLEYSLKELIELNPQENEAKELAEQRILLNNSVKIKESIDKLEHSFSHADIISSLNKIIKQVNATKHILGENPYLDDLDSLLTEVYEKIDLAQNIVSDIEKNYSFNPYDLAKVEERLFSLKSIAKKHQVSPENIENLIIDFKNKIDEINASENNLQALEQEVENALQNFQKLASLLSKERHKVAEILNVKINSELAFLKLNGALFKTVIEEVASNSNGTDKIIFQVKTNQGADFGELNKIASGGEMSRFMLAMKVVLAEVDIINTIILDEIDMGVGGEVAEAIGNRLLFLSKNIQTMVVTHSHQVASRGQFHYKVIKETVMGETTSKVVSLDASQRINEIARMISGQEVTEEAKATAKKLLEAVSS
jgi:DNA repair protein RecN (Recombination protein N)